MVAQNEDPRGRLTVRPTENDLEEARVKREQMNGPEFKRIAAKLQKVYDAQIKASA